MSDTFADYITRERNRLYAARDEVINQQRELDAKLAEIGRQFTAVEAYEGAKRGTPMAVRSGSMQTSRGGTREEVLRVLRQGDGLTRGEILMRLGSKGDKRAEARVTTALVVLSKNGEIRRGEDRKYVAA